MERNRWLKCEEDNYWSSELGVETIVQYEGKIYTRDSWFGGWSMLVKSESKLMHVEL